MSYTPAQFAAEIALNGKTFYAYPNVKAELTLLSTAVKADLTHHSREIETPLGILQNPNSYYQGRNQSDHQQGQGRESDGRADGRRDGRRGGGNAITDSLTFLLTG